MNIFGNQFIEAGNSAFSGSMTGMVVQSGPVARAILLILLIVSIIAWAIMFQKMWVFRKANKESKKFIKIFEEKKGGLSSAYTVSKLLKNSHLAKIFISGYLDIVSLQKFRRESKLSSAEVGKPLKHEDLLSLKRALDKKESQEINRFEKNLGFLATTGSTAPFIGLFGTVWGIMDAFRSIGIKGSASIGGVAPGISEALITTAAGLVAAIPAVIGYNHFSHKIKVIASEMDEFSLEFLSIIERGFLRKK